MTEPGEKCMVDGPPVKRRTGSRSSALRRDSIPHDTTPITSAPPQVASQ